MFLALSKGTMTFSFHLLQRTDQKTPIELQRLRIFPTEMNNIFDLISLPPRPTIRC